MSLLLKSRKLTSIKNKFIFPILSQWNLFYHSKNGSYGYNPNCLHDTSAYQIPSETLKLRNENPNLHRYISAYREFGHLKAQINPLEQNLRIVPELNPEFYSLSPRENVSAKGLLYGEENSNFSLEELDKKLQDIYCGDMSAEFMYLNSLEEREWFGAEIEKLASTQISDEEKREMATDLLKSQVWDYFLALKFPTVKRYGAEGAEASMIFYKDLFRELSKNSLFYLTHVLRLIQNSMKLILALAEKTMFVTTVLRRSRICYSTRFWLYVIGFRVPCVRYEILMSEDCVCVVESYANSGYAYIYYIYGRADWNARRAERNKEITDEVIIIFVLGCLFRCSLLPYRRSYKNIKITRHLHFSIVSSVYLDVGGTKPLHVTMLFNPSHLEAEVSVACGKTRGRQRRLKDGHYSTDEGNRAGDKVVCLLVHGDGALSGQGIIQETLGIADVPNFSIGGSIHLCINNQISYTTPPDRGRSSMYCTDVAKMCAFPVIHVNGDVPELVAYNRKFRRDVFVDLCCWRRWGHNELDDPRFTNPGMYKIIDNKMSVPDSYAKQLVEEKIWTEEEKIAVSKTANDYLNKRLAATDQYKPQSYHLRKHWGEMKEAPNSIETWDTGVDVMLLKFLGAKSVAVPDNFVLYPHLQKTFVAARLARLSSGEGLDWATGEALAMASLLHQGYDVRISGEDVGRGTFSQRHCMLVDQESDEIYIPLNHMTENQTSFLEVANSTLSEEGVLGFEYGVSIESPKILCIWEAQFGDFFNTAQPIFDTFLSAAEEKWLLQSGLTVILPHGYDGAGPEHFLLVEWRDSFK
ncbi:putative 2-oxoglutarate dehydrogenase E1 component DHKTD1, mitochondrial [Armadillidium vulgare]|nr:putative 2-oxoglutarate dehydrogenase E1 component DHKTD1, mitochondrial [Armadillidium vulgare]